MNGRQPRNRVARLGDVVEADDSDVLRDTQAKLVQSLDGAEGHFIVEAKNRRDLRILPQKFLCRLHATFLGQPAVDDQIRVQLDAAFAKHFLKRFINVAACLNLPQTARDKPNAPMSQMHQMLRRLPRAVFVVRNNIVEVELFRVIIDEKQRPRPISEVLQKSVAGVRSYEKDPVHELLIVKLEVFPGLDKFAARHLEQDFVPQLASSIVNTADDLAEVDVGEGVSQLRHNYRESASVPPSQCPSHPIR